MVGAAGAAIQIGNIIDLLGQGVGTAPVNIFGNTTLFGQDPGTGLIKPLVEAIVGTAFATSNSATLTVQLQYAADQGSGGSYQPSTWYTIIATGALTAAQLAAGTVFSKFDWQPVFPATIRPRYVRLNGAVPAATNFTAGTITFAGVMIGRDDFAQKLTPKNFAV
ncbi:MAG TPA: hypothetical protein VMU08_13875 [Rhizomicrobium sp.]|nr:hypothetical protein [Rhizomicrobium sp.]